MMSSIIWSPNYSVTMSQNNCHIPLVIGEILQKRPWGNLPCSCVTVKTIMTSFTTAERNKKNYDSNLSEHLFYIYFFYILRAYENTSAHDM